LVAITGCSVHWNPSTDARRHEQVFVRREITSDGQGAAVTLGYSEAIISLRKLGYLVPCVWSAREARGFCEPHRTPQVGDTAADPHRNPTDDTAHSGTLVLRVKHTENSR
jgi:hypothetical protein